VSTRLLSIEGPFGVFAERLLALELPDLPDDRRADAVEFTSRRANEVPSPLKLGISVLTAAVGLAQRVLGNDAVTSFLQDTSLPFVGELARMVRSLAFAFIWESWPNTSPTGAPDTVVSSGDAA